MTPTEVGLGAGWLVALGLALRGPKVIRQVVEVEKRIEPLPEVQDLPEGDLGGNRTQPGNVPFGHLYLQDGLFRVVQTTHDGRRARLMWERGVPGKTEILELYHGPDCRGRKTGP